MNLLFVALIPIFIAIFFVSIDYVFGQQVVDTAAPTVVPPNVVTTSSPSANGTDLMITAGGIGATIIGLLYKDKQDKKEVEKTTKQQIKGTDVDSAKMFILYNKILQYAYLYPEYTLKQILDLPATQNVMDKETIGQVIARETNQWANFIQESYNIARPQMSVATATGVHAAQDAAKNPPTVNTATKGND